MKLISLFEHVSITKKFILSLFLFVIIPLVCMLVFIHIDLRNRINQQVCERNLAILMQSKSGLLTFINDTQFVSVDILGDELIQKMIKKNRDPDSLLTEKDRYDASFSIQELMASRSHISSIAVFDTASTIFQFGDIVQSEDLSRLPEVEALNGRVLWTGSYQNRGLIEDDSEDYEVSLLRQINDLYAMRPLAYERISVDERYIHSLYAAKLTSSESSLYIINKDSEIVSASDSSLLQPGILDREYLSLLHGAEGFFRYKDRMISFYQLPEVGWTIIKDDSVKELFAGTEILSTIMVISIVLTLLFGLFFITIQRKSIIEPIVSLSSDMQNFKEGNLYVQEYSHSPDEVGQLNRSIIEMSMYIHNLIELEYKARIRTQEIELMAMQSQINPHFLYNTLDSIRWMALRERQPAIALQVEALSNLFRHVLNSGKDITTIGEELDHLKDYMLIQKNRFGDRIDMQILMPEPIESYRVLKLILQPLVENAIVHGLEKKRGPGHVNVTLDQTEQSVTICVEDDGVGIDEEIIRRVLSDSNDEGRYFALRNIQARIQHTYGPEYGLTFSSRPGRGSKVVIILPRDKLDICDVKRKSR